jgi:catalase (peroxidase I)
MTFTLNVVRGWSVGDTGGTQATLGNVQKVRSAMTQTQVDIRYPTTGTLTAAAATAGIEDPAPFASAQMDCPAAPLRAQPMQEFLDESWFTKPLTLTNNEGFRVRNQSAYGAVGTSVVVFSVFWSEYPAAATFFY